MGDSLLLEQHIVDPSSAPQSRFPVANFQISEIIDGVKTEFVTTEFEDKLFFVITQISKLGTLVMAQKEEVGDSGCYSIEIVLGKRDDLRIDCLARSICEFCVNENIIPASKPILFAIGLQNQTSIESVKNILNFAKKFLK